MVFAGVIVVVLVCTALICHREGQKSVNAKNSKVNNANNTTTNIYNINININNNNY